MRLRRDTLLGSLPLSVALNYESIIASPLLLAFLLLFLPIHSRDETAKKAKQVAAVREEFKAREGEREREIIGILF